MSFVEIKNRCEAKEWAPALDLALAEWRRTKAPAYGDLVEAISAKTKAPPIPFIAGQGMFQSRWLERAANATESDVVPLLATFTTELSTARARPGWDTTAAARRVRAALAIENVRIEDWDYGVFMPLSGRLEALAALGPDPRIARNLVIFMRNLPFPTRAAIGVATYGPVLDLIADMNDVRMIPPLERLLVEPPAQSPDLRAFLERALSRVLTTLRSVAIETPPDAHSVAALAHELGFRGESEVVTEPERDTDLFELVVRDLDDDGPRAVLADRWLEQRDPRGELVTLQLRGATSPADLEKIRAIIHYDRDWLGELALVTRSRIYVRGFLEEFELPPPAAATPERWEAATQNPNLGTVRRIRCGAGREAHYRAFLFSPALRNLEEADIPSLALLREVLESPNLGKLRRITLILESLVDVDVRNAVVAITARGEIERVTLACPSQRVTQLMSVLPLATERTSVAVIYDDATIIASRTSEGLVLTGDAKERMAIYLATRACPDAIVRVNRHD